MPLSWITQATPANPGISLNEHTGSALDGDEVVHLRGEVYVGDPRAAGRPAFVLPVAHAPARPIRLDCGDTQGPFGSGPYSPGVIEIQPNGNVTPRVLPPRGPSSGTFNLEGLVFTRGT